MSAVQQLHKRRRKIVKKLGKRTIRALAGFMGSQSTVGDRPAFDPASFPLIDAFEENWSLIHDEIQQVLENPDQLPAFHEISPDQKRISRDNLWKTFILFGFGSRFDRNCDRCPETTHLLENVPGLQSAWFSILSPGYHIPAHRGVTKGVLRVHLGLIVPKQREKCVMRVGDQMLSWQQGKCLIFDDTFEHEIWNNTDEQRVVLLFDFDRPMRLPGRMVSKSLLWALKKTAYFKDVKRNMNAWEDRFEAAVQRAETMFDEPSDESQDDMLAKSNGTKH